MCDEWRVCVCSLSRVLFEQFYAVWVNGNSEKTFLWQLRAYQATYRTIEWKPTLNERAKLWMRKRKLLTISFSANSYANPVTVVSAHNLSLALRIVRRRDPGSAWWLYFWYISAMCICLWMANAKMRLFLTNIQISNESFHLIPSEYLSNVANSSNSTQHNFFRDFLFTLDFCRCFVRFWFVMGSFTSRLPFTITFIWLLSWLVGWWFDLVCILPHTLSHLTSNRPMFVTKYTSTCTRTTHNCRETDWICVVVSCLNLSNCTFVHDEKHTQPAPKDILLKTHNVTHKYLIANCLVPWLSFSFSSLLFFFFWITRCGRADGVNECERECKCVCVCVRASLQEISSQTV